jgi:predicted N-formylglutamate amidohydrolase
MDHRVGAPPGLPGSVRAENRAGMGPVVLLCDHASNFVPAEYGTLGLDPRELDRHIAWDPGALPVARAMSELLDAPLVAAGVSRLIIDCNRPLQAPDLIPETSESTTVPANLGLDAAERARRVALSHAPFHAEVEALVEERGKAGQDSWLVSIHSFTPIYRGVARPWQVGILHDADRRLSDPMLAALDAMPGLTVGDNEPYSPADRVYYTLERHARSRGLPCVMIEIRNDEIATEAGQVLWAERLAGLLKAVSVEEAGADS